MAKTLNRNPKAFRIMVVAAHPDDAELALGASLSIWADSGVETFIVDLTNGEPTPFGSPRKRLKEASDATAILNLAGRRCLGFKNRELAAVQRARRSLAGVIREVRPDVIFAHYWTDVHPDHVAACEITEAARFEAKLSKNGVAGEPFFVPKIFYYPSIHVRLRALPAFVIEAAAGKDAKLRSIAAYRSQFKDNPKNSDVIRRVCTDGEYWGDQINSGFGEPIYARDPVGVSPTALLPNRNGL